MFNGIQVPTSLTKLHGGARKGGNPTIRHTSGSPEHPVSLMSSPSMWYCGASCPHTGTPEPTETHPTRTHPSSHTRTHSPSSCSLLRFGWLAWYLLSCSLLVFMASFNLQMKRKHERKTHDNVTSVRVCTAGSPIFSTTPLCHISKASFCYPLWSHRVG